MMNAIGKSGSRKLAWLPVSALMAAISYLSSQSYRQQSVKERLTEALACTPLGDWLAGVRFRYGSLTVDGRTDGPGGVLEFFVRKLAHFAEFGLLGAGLLLAARYAAGWSLSACAGFAFAAAVAYAGADELHQLFSAGRGPRTLDVAVDAAGALAGIALAAALAGRGKPERPALVPKRERRR